MTETAEPGGVTVATVLRDVADSRALDLELLAGAAGLERSFEPWNRVHLVPTVLPQLDGVVPALERGVKVADIGPNASTSRMRSPSVRGERG